MQFGRIFQLLCLIAVVVTTGGAAGCYQVIPDPYPAMGQRCSIASDQEDSLHQRIRLLPVRVVIDREFDARQRELITTAAEKWNAFSQASLGLRFFEIEAEDSAAARVDLTRLPRSFDYCKLPQDRLLPGLLIRRQHDAEAWSNEGLHETAGGVAHRCSVGTASTPPVLLIVTNTRISTNEKLLSVMLHELGHALGLGHSCTADKTMVTTHYRTCEGISKSHPYRQAVMFPELVAYTVGGATSAREVFEARDELRANDLERAFCLYTVGSRLDRLRDKAKAEAQPPK